MDSSQWPCIENSDQLEVLNEIADSTFNTETFEGYISAILIYHQIIESMIIHLLEDCCFFIQLSVYPLEYKHKIEKDKMMGAYIKELKSTLEFENKQLFISKCMEFNKIRNNIVHGITKKRDLSDINENAKNGKIIFNIVFELYDDIQDWFRVCFKDFKKDIFIDIVGDETDETE